MLITIFGPISGAHFNPAVTVALASARAFAWRDVLPYVLTQIAAAFAGVAAAHVMFELPLFSASEHVRVGPGPMAQRKRRDRGAAVDDLPWRARGPRAWARSSRSTLRLLTGLRHRPRLQILPSPWRELQPARLRAFGQSTPQGLFWRSSLRHCLLRKSHGGFTTTRSTASLISASTQSQHVATVPRRSDAVRPGLAPTRLPTCGWV